AAWIPRRRTGPGAHYDRLHEQLQQVRETEGAGARLEMTILVTGGAGFIGSNFVLDWFAQGAGPVINLDKLTYAGNPANLHALKESTSFAPYRPYAASKAAADHLVRAYHHTYGLPTLTVNCSNNYGPYQFPEKLIPLMILNAITHKPLPVYGEGGNVRDWLYVQDHCTAIRQVLERGRVGESYNVGGYNQKTNL